MILEDLIKVINDVDGKFVIFQKNELSIDSEIALFDGEEEESTRLVITKDNVKYLYLLEVFIAKEFIEDWVGSLRVKPSSKEIALRLFQYAINDA